jgi:hypothetical protein
MVVWAYFGVTLGLMVSNGCPTWGWLAWTGAFIVGNIIGSIVASA